MTVYLVPTAGPRYEMYCEVSTSPPSDEAREGTVWSRLVRGFRRMVAEGEADRHAQPAGLGERGRLRRAITRRIAEAVAEQRLLWHLRHETTAVLVHPDDVTGPAARSLSQALFTAEFAKHRRWCAIDALITAVTGPVFFFVPGPNVVSWYFAFRALGHYFALRGAKQGMTGVGWTTRASPALTDLRTALSLDRDLRDRRVAEIAASLGLDRLPVFIERVA